jgi:hypothetical protein
LTWRARLPTLADRTFDAAPCGEAVCPDTLKGPQKFQLKQQKLHQFARAGTAMRCRRHSGSNFLLGTGWRRFRKFLY